MSMDRRPTDSPTLREVPGKGWVAHDPELRASASGATAHEAAENLRDLMAAYPEIILRETSAGSPLTPARLIHDHFGLSYANYLVLPRTLLQSMPEPWQARFVGMLEELNEAFRDVPQARTYTVISDPDP